MVCDRAGPAPVCIEVAKGSPVAAMSLLSSAPAVLVRLTTEQLTQWAEPGGRLLFEDGNIEQILRSDPVIRTLGRE